MCFSLILKLILKHFDSLEDAKFQIQSIYNAFTKTGIESFRYRAFIRSLGLIKIKINKSQFLTKLSTNLFLQLKITLFFGFREVRFAYSISMRFFYKAFCYRLKYREYYYRLYCFYFTVSSRRDPIFPHHVY